MKPVIVVVGYFNRNISPSIYLISHIASKTGLYYPISQVPWYGIIVYDYPTRLLTNCTHGES